MRITIFLNINFFSLMLQVFNNKILTVSAKYFYSSVY